MPDADQTSLAGLLERARNGDSRAADELFVAVYEELHGMAKRQMRRQSPDHTLQATALVNEVYLRVFGQHWNDKQHFLAIAARAMRSILVDNARRKGRARRVSDEPAGFQLDSLTETYGQRSGDLLALDEALDRLKEFDPGLVRLVELRFFAGMQMKDIAEHLGISLRSAHRQWSTARAWLGKEIG